MEKKTFIPVLITIACGVAIIRMLRKQTDAPATLVNHNWDMRTNSKLPRGYRNNNPLNIRISSSEWKGKSANNTDGVFEQFVDLAYGYRAALVTIRTYIRKYGLDTVRKIISRWAPENENNTEAYIKHVCEIADLNENNSIGLNDKDTLTRLVYAMAIIENGQNDETRAAGLPNMKIINEGWNLL